MIFQSPGDVAFTIFGFPVYYYGLIMAVAIFIGIYTAYYLYKKYYSVEDAEKIFDIAPYMIILGVLGARLYYCVVNYGYYMNHPLEIFDIRQGGLSIHGMLFVGIVALYFFAKKYKLSFLKLADVFLCATPLSQAIGRWGNFFNSEAFGIPTNLPWGLYIPIDKRPLIYIHDEFFHPAFLYESVLNLLVFLILLFMIKRLNYRPGLVACLYISMYSLVRYFVEGFRIDSVLDIGGTPIAQIVSLFLSGFAIVALIFVIYFNNESKN